MDKAKDVQGSFLHYGKLPSSGDGASRRRFLKLAMTGTASAFLFPSFAFSVNSYSTDGPVVIRKSPKGDPIRLKDGSLKLFHMELNKHVQSIRSKDHGLTWSEPQVEFSISGETGRGCRALLDQNGKIHIWYQKRGKDNPRFPGNRNLDIWHTHTLDNHSEWAKPQLVWEGYGSVRDAIQMDEGRIVVPLGVRKTGNEELPENTGTNYTTVINSDDGGRSWQRSAVRLTSPGYEGYNGVNYGATEPCITQLPDGRLWMLMRTQTGYLFESYSNDAVNWTPARASRFASSTAPASLVKLDDNRILLFWNNHEMPPRVNGKGVYGGRDGLHAAISEDNGQSWHGFREVYLDPTRNETPPRRGDRGTAYPNSVATDDGHILLVTGQANHARAMIRFHPDWLYEKSRRHDFTTDGLEDWCVYKGIGPANHWWRDRVAGAQLITHPDKKNARVLHVRRPDKHYADGATWNFPARVRGTLKLKIRFNQGFAGAQISLADRLFDPIDDGGEQFSIFQLLVEPDGQVNAKKIFKPDQWHILTLQWDIEKVNCKVSVDGNLAIRLPMANPTVNGISYLRLRSTAGSVDQKGLFVEAVEAEVA